MALLSRIKSPDWQDGDILTAADLKAEFNNIVNGLNGLADIAVISITATGAYSGTSSSLTGNSSVGGSLSVTGSAAITGNCNAALIHAGSYSPGWVDNLGLSLSSGTLTITDASGSALGANNVGWVTMPSTTAGQFVTLKVNAAASIANTATTNLEWGATAGADWAVDKPMFLYVVNKGNNNVVSSDGNSCFFLSPDPRMSTTPASANSIGDKDAIPATDDQNAILVMASITEANYTSLPCQLVGAVRMRYATSTHIWSFQTLGNSDGFGQIQLDKTFSTDWSYPQGQNGASANTYLLPNGGTAPVFTTNTYNYILKRNGEVQARVHLSGDGGTDGVGAVGAILAVPYVIKYVATRTTDTLIGSALGATTITGSAIMLGSLVDGVDSFALFYPSSAVALSAITNGMFTNGNRIISANFSFKAF